MSEVAALPPQRHDKEERSSMFDFSSSREYPYTSHILQLVMNIVEEN